MISGNTDPSKSPMSPSQKHLCATVTHLCPSQTHLCTHRHTYTYSKRVCAPHLSCQSTLLAPPMVCPTRPLARTIPLPRPPAPWGGPEKGHLCPQVLLR